MNCIKRDYLEIAFRTVSYMISALKVVQNVIKVDCHCQSVCENYVAL